MFAAPKIKDMSPLQLKAAFEAQDILLIDVREPGEFAAERIAFSVNAPLSTFDPAALPAPCRRTIVLQCAGGTRSAMAADRCRKAGRAIDTHLAGGLAARKAAGLPTVRA